MSSPPISAHEDQAMSASDIILKLSNIESYYGPIMAIRGISLEVPRGDRAGVAEDLERVFGYFPRLRERINQPAGQLSGGEQQMLAIGRALMNRPTLLLLDEPSLGLSPILVKEIFTIIKRVNEEQGMSILLVEQNAKVALETAHYGYVLEIGRVVMNDTCERLMNSKDIQEFYLGAKEEGARGERRWKKKKTWR